MTVLEFSQKYVYIRDLSEAEYVKVAEALGTLHALGIIEDYRVARDVKTLGVGNSADDDDSAALLPADGVVGAPAGEPHPNYYARCGYCERKWLAVSTDEKCAVCEAVPFEQKGLPYFDTIQRTIPSSSAPVEDRNSYNPSNPLHDLEGWIVFYRRAPKEGQS